MKVGDMVQYVAHTSWDNGGLGILTDVQQYFDPLGQVCQRFQVTWLDDIEEYGWDAAIGGAAQWYDDIELGTDIRLFAETQ
mgnify:CR=1 FL=1